MAGTSGERSKSENSLRHAVQPLSIQCYAFRLQGTPATFQRLMDQILRGLQKFSSAYLDGVIIFSESWLDHITHVRFELLRAAGLTVKARKCQFGMTECHYLGHVAGSGLMQAEPAKIEAVE